MIHSSTRSLFLPAAALALLSAGMLAPRGSAQIIDTFSDTDVSEYSLTRILDNSPGTGIANISFASPSGALAATFAGASSVEQVLFLRGDFSLPVGQILRLDTGVSTTIANGGTIDLGLAIAATATPAATGNPTPTDTRTLTDFLSISIRPSQDSLRVNSSNAGVLTTGSFVTTAVENTVTQLFISRTAPLSFSFGWVNAAAVETTIGSVTFTSPTSTIGNAVGFYSDIREATTIGTVDNLRIVPEPASGVLLSLGLAMCAARRRTRK